jgi:hypothetical protein
MMKKYKCHKCNDQKEPCIIIINNDKRPNICPFGMWFCTYIDTFEPDDFISEKELDL